jgi:polysaccharide pyruvyl transferase WcaK-like protein
MKNMKRRDGLRIGLLTPYTGGNLGDAAIQFAVIDNIRLRIPDCELYGLTLFPAATQKLHDIPCYPLTRLRLPYYALAEQAKESVGQDQLGQPGNTGIISGIRQGLKRKSWLYPVLRSFKQFLLAVATIMRNVATDISHTCGAFTLCRSSDALLISGGGQLDDYWGGAWGHPYTLFKWVVLGRLAGARVVVLSVGACSMRSKASRFFFRVALRLSDYRSYRDGGSKRLLSAWRFTNVDHVIPDLAFSYQVPQGRSKNMGGGKPRIGVSPIAHLSPHYWPQKEKHIFENYVAMLTEFVAEKVSQGYEIVFFTTATPDTYVITQVVSRLRLMNGTNEFERSTEIRQTRNLQSLYELLSEVDLVVASRLHGIILSQLAGIPVLAISYDRKVSAHMEDLQMQDFCIDFHTLSSRQLSERFERLAADSQAIKVHLTAEVKRRRDRLADEYDHLVADFNSGKRSRPRVQEHLE